MPTLSKYYKLAALLPLALTSISGIILSISHDGGDYKSEWSTDDGFVLTVFLTILLSLMIALLSLTIFLNSKSSIKENIVLSLISWILLAGALCVFVIYQELLNFSAGWNIDNYEGSRLLDGYILSVAGIHLLGLLITFIHFNSKRSLLEK